MWRHTSQHAGGKCYALASRACRDTCNGERAILSLESRGNLTTPHSALRALLLKHQARSKAADMRKPWAQAWAACP